MKLKDITKEYPNDEVTIVWKPKKCIHSEKCWRNLPEVFRHGKKPWVDPNGKSAEDIKIQIDQSPSGALSYYSNKEGNNTNSKPTVTVVDVAPDGPLLVKGEFEIKKADGTISVETNAALCRCGASTNKPYCDGSHVKVNFTD